jgi:hypothetical protein
MANKVGGALPATASDKSECLWGVQPDVDAGMCAKDILHKYRDYLKDNDPLYGARMPAKEILARLKKLLKVDSESGILTHPDFKNYIGSGTSKRLLNSRFKPEGPAFSTALLDNFNIDNILAAFASDDYRRRTGRKFFHIPFQMIDFAKVKSELARISIPSVIGAGYDSFGVVLNTDVSSGGGKHWFCLYGDLQHKGTESDPYVIEYFNSSGNPAHTDVTFWMEKTCRDIMLTLEKHAVTLRAVNRQLQTSRTECGMWSILYIKSRLEGHPPDWFYKNRTTDKDIENFRKYVFRWHT